LLAYLQEEKIPVLRKEDTHKLDLATAAISSF
jgi:hypothetical protein